MESSRNDGEPNDISHESNLQCWIRTNEKKIEGKTRHLVILPEMLYDSALHDRRASKVVANVYKFWKRASVEIREPLYVRILLWGMHEHSDKKAEQWLGCLFSQYYQYVVVV